MPKTYPNQKVITIHKPTVTGNFLQISKDEWMQANKTLTPFGLQLYLYLASNADGYPLSLSPQHADEAAGIKHTTFYKYFDKLEEEGYLVWRKGNVFDFYTSPRPQNERSDPDSHSEYMFFDDNPPDEYDSSYHIQNIPQSDREIYNKNIIDNETLRISTPAADAACYPTGKVVEISIPSPVPRDKMIPKPKPKPFASMFDLDSCTDPDTGEFVF